MITINTSFVDGIVMEKIDFVIPWVDGDDLAWRVEKQKWEALSKGINSASEDANTDCRYRSDNEMLRYWFRSVENFAPWVNRIHFVTCGQKPSWLNENHPKLNMVNHKDYIPSKYLPTFNSNVIELNYHRINDLSENFVLFNDDIFLLQPVKEVFFFRSGYPVLDTNLRYTNMVGCNSWSRVLFNDYCIVNKNFVIGRSIWENRKKWFSIKELGYKRARKNLLCYLANKTLPVSLYGHIAHPILKSTLQELWERCPDVMEQTSRHKFRSDDQVNQWLFCAWAQAEGRFFPAREDRLGKNFSISSSIVNEVCEMIKNQSFPQICVNDTEKNDNPDYCYSELIKAFDSILPEQSQFEKF